MSDWEKCCVIGSFINLTEDRYNCEERAKKEKVKRNFRTLQLARDYIAQQNGCNRYNLSMQIEGFPYVFKTCWCNLQHPQFEYFMILFNNYEKGNLPEPGTINEQPYWYIELFNLLSHLKALKEKKDMEEQRKESEKKSQVRKK